MIWADIHIYISAFVYDRYSLYSVTKVILGENFMPNKTWTRTQNLLSYKIAASEQYNFPLGKQAKSYFVLSFSWNCVKPNQ